MFLGMGTDMEYIGSVAGKKALRFSKAFFTEEELSYCENRIESFTALICVKESCIKALGSLKGAPAYFYKDIELRHHSSGRPYLNFHGSLKRFLDQKKVRSDVSITHTHDFASAIVVLYGGHYE